MAEIISKYREYFKLISVYNKASASKQPALLAGFIQLNTRTHPDPTTRNMLVKFYVKEVLRHGNQISA